MRKRVFEDVDICIDNRYVNVGKKFKVKEMCDKFIDDEFVNLVIDWFCEGIEEEWYGELFKVINCFENCFVLVMVKIN